MTDQELQEAREKLAEEPFHPASHKTVESAFPLPEQSRQYIDFYRQMQRQSPEDWRHLVNLARAYSKTGKDSLAVVQLQKLLRTDAGLLEVWIDLAECYQRLHKSELALRAYNSAIDIEPSFERAHLARVSLLVETEELEEAAAAVVFSLACRDLSAPLVELLEEIDEHLESGLLPPQKLVERLSAGQN